MNKSVDWHLVTGASRGIGKAIALELAKPGNGLILWATKESSLHELESLITAMGIPVIIQGVDLRNPEHIRSAWAHVEKTIECLKSVTHNAGIWDEHPISVQGWEQWDDALDVNLKAPMLLTALTRNHMAVGGAYVFMGSLASKKVYYGGANYCAAKWGLLGFTGCLFEEVRDAGIKVVTIFPGQVDTDMHKNEPGIVEERLIQPQDIADTVKFVLSLHERVCPTEIVLQPQRNPKPRK